MSKLNAERMAYYNAEYERLCKRRELWGALSNDHFRMRRLGGLQTQMERVERKAAAANNAIGRLRPSSQLKSKSWKSFPGCN